MSAEASPATSPAPRPQRILIIRLDRIGDVVLSTPVIQQLRAAYPSAFIAMLVKPECQALVDGNPALNAALVYDKAGRHRGASATIAFARALRRERFDTALILHPTTRSHWIARLAGIPTRIGYDRKSAWLLTHRVPHRKQEGRRHEAEYALEMLRVLGIEPKPPRPTVPVDAQARRRVGEVLAQHGVAPERPIVVIHPSASCLSKRWMPERFAALADWLIGTTPAAIVLIAGPSDAEVARQVASAMTHRPINLAGQLSVAETAALLARGRLLISNDSGPVHIAAAVETPVVDIFGRNQPGLGPARWGPLGDGHVVLQHDVGCTHCLAHRCTIGFACLTSLSVAEVYLATMTALGRSPRPDPRPIAG